MKFITTLCFCFITFNLLAVVPVFSDYGQKHGLDEASVKSIVEDHLGLIWVGTRSGVFHFDGLSFKKIDTSSISDHVDVQSLFVDRQDNLWIGTRKNGLLLYSNNLLSQIGSNETGIYSINEIIQGSKNRLWLATNIGLFNISDDAPQTKKMIRPELTSLMPLQNKRISAIESLDRDRVVITHADNFYILDFKQDLMEKISLNKNITIHDLYIDTNKKLWLATSKQLLRYDLTNKKEISVPLLVDASRILSIDQYQDDIWVATIDGGVYQIDVNTLVMHQYTYRKEFQHSLSEKHIVTLYISRGGFLWLGGFSKGLNLLNLNSLRFGFETDIVGSINCAKSSEIYSVNVDSMANIWLGSSYGLIKYNPKQGDCEIINTNITETNNYTVYSTRFDGGFIWVSGSMGLLKYNKISGEAVNMSNDLDTPVVYFSHKLMDNKLLVGTGSGLFEYDLNNQVYDLLDYPKEKYKNIAYKEFAINQQGEIVLASPEGMLYLNKQGQLNEFEGGDKLFANIDVTNVQISAKNEMFISVKNRGLYHLNSDNEIIQHYSTEQLLPPSTSVYQIILDEANDTVWLGSDKGIVYIDLITKESQLFSGIPDENYLSLTQSSYRGADGKIYFSGYSGYVGFYPEEIKLRQLDSPVVINELYLMNDPIRVGIATASGFLLKNKIENSQHLDFGYMDKIIGFEFIKLNYHNPMAVKYKYKLEPVSADWMEMRSGDRSLTFTNLKAGEYNLLLKATDINGEWDVGSTSLSFNVKAPPWLTLWAFISYILVLILLIFFYIHKKTQAQKKINKYLNTQVKEQTKHIRRQKQTVEDLMARKNEIFSNVSHEFRTPITLILGPVEELKKEEPDAAKKEYFEMISRNAKRLLNLVNQMLKLSQIAEMQNHEKEVVNVAAQLNLITEPFVYLADKNNIELIIEKFADVDVQTTEGAFETTIGNFLSNAIKYTADNGQVIIGTHVNENRVEIYVKDSGCGISVEQQKNVFKRFNRLSQHGSIQGVGIGLALVQEVADLNDAELLLESEVGKGSVFSISFAIHNETVDASAQLFLGEIVSDASQLTDDNTLQGLNETVLIIEDNDDMRSYINNVLSKQFNCILAVDGIDGIGKALKHVPDIIICDVMMPKMNGFQVCRRLRNEMMTSHIPLVLLTALDDKSSRIKGWRENIDMYLNKPFDASELLLQLRNILNIRNIIAQSNETGKSNKLHSSLSEIDQQFIEKLKSIVEAEYANPLLNLEKIAGLMFVSDRQLQRKTKALINKSPMDFIREIRLKSAAQILKDGYRISIASDKCGFSSVSYFSQAFKKHYGLSPKEYQTLNKK